MMTSAVRLAFSLLVVSQLCAADEAATPRPITVDAAWSAESHGNTYLILFSGDLVFEFMNGDFQGDLLVKEAVNTPESFQTQIQAAFTSFKSDHKQFYYGKTEAYKVDRGTEKIKRLRYGQYRKFLQGGGPDAAARRDDHVVFFRGCYMADRFKWSKWGKPRDFRPLGLPCHIDAAWKDGDAVVALKGDQIWRWELDDSVTGPHPFQDTYNWRGRFVLVPSDKSDNK